MSNVPPPPQYLIPPSTPAPRKKKNPILLGCGGFLAFALLVGILAPKSPTPPQEPSPTKETASVADEPAEFQLMRTRVEKKDWPSLPDPNDDLLNIALSAGDMLGPGRTLFEASKLDQTPDQKKLVKSFRVAAADWQTKQFPKLRSIYAKKLAETLAADGVELSVSGKANQTLDFVGAMFTTRDAVNGFLSGYKDDFIRMRFTRLNFLTRKGQSGIWVEFTSPKDSDFVYYDDDDKIRMSP